VIDKPGIGVVLRDDIEAQSREFAIPPQELLAAFKEALEKGKGPLEAQAILREMAVVIAATRAGGKETGSLAGALQQDGTSGLKVLDLVADLQAQRRAGGDLEVREIAGPLGRLRQDFATELGGGAEILREAAAALQFFAEGGRDPADAEADVKTLIEALKDEKVRKDLQAGGIDLGAPGDPLAVGRILEEILRKSQGDRKALEALGGKKLADALKPAVDRAGGAAAAPARLETFRGAQGGVQDLRDTAAENASGFLATVERGLTDIFNFVESGVDATLGNLEPETRQSLVTGGLIGGGAVAGGLAGAGLFKLVGGLLGAGVTKVWITNPRDYFTGFGDGGFADGEGGGRRRRGGKRKTGNRRRIGGRRRGVAGRLFDFGRRGVSRLRDVASPRAGGGLKRVLDIGRGAAGRVTNAVRTTAGGGFSRLFDFAKRGAGAARRGLSGGLAALTGTTPGAAASLPATGGAGRLLGSVAKGGKALLKRVPFLGTLVAATTGISALTDDSLDATQKGKGVGSSAGAIIGGTLGLIAGPVGAIAGSFIGEKLGGALGALAGGLFEDDQPPVPAAAQDRETAAVTAAGLTGGTAAGLAGGTAGRATPPKGKLEVVVTFDDSLEPRVKEMIFENEQEFARYMRSGPTNIIPG
jgi:hypothetical protein